MKVVYIGCIKTGTYTMKMVLQELGYSCYALEDNFYYLSKYWHKVMTHGGDVKTFKEMFKDVDVTMDVPSYMFWEEILEAFPDAKLIVNFREEEKWLLSFTNHMEVSNGNIPLKILSVLSPTCQRFLMFIRHSCNFAYGCDFSSMFWQAAKNVNYKQALVRYRQHNMYIKQRAPKDRLLVVDYKQGWEPICKFLGVPIPDKPFPHENKAAEIVQKIINESPMFVQIKKEAIISLSLIVLIIALMYFLL